MWLEDELVKKLKYSKKNVEKFIQPVKNTFGVHNAKTFQYFCLFSSLKSPFWEEF